MINKYNLNINGKIINHDLKYLIFYDIKHDIENAIDYIIIGKLSELKSPFNDTHWDMFDWEVFFYQRIQEQIRQKSLL